MGQNKYSIEQSPSLFVQMDDIAGSILDLIVLSRQNQLLQSEQLKRLDEILRIQKLELDEGKVLKFTGNVTTTQFAFFNTTDDPGHMVKGLVVTNDGDNTILFGWNVVQDGLEPHLEDIRSNTSRYDSVLAGDSEKYIFNTKCIYNVAIIGDTGSSSFRLKLVW